MLLGIGGGAIIVPALATALSVMGFDGDVVQHVAVGTSLAIIIPTGIASARAHARRGAVDGEVLKLWAPFIVAATLIGGLMAGLFSGDVLRIVFGVMALFIAANILLPFQERLMGHLGGSKLTHRIAAAVVGYISALMGVGGGSLSVPTLHAFGATMHRAGGTGRGDRGVHRDFGTLGFIISGWSAEGRPPLKPGLHQPAGAGADRRCGGTVRPVRRSHRAQAAAANAETGVRCVSRLRGAEHAVGRWWRGRGCALHPPTLASATGLCPSLRLPSPRGEGRIGACLSRRGPR